jgi:DNA-binding NarL/FixJ family response regulator
MIEKRVVIVDDDREYLLDLEQMFSRSNAFSGDMRTFSSPKSFKDWWNGRRIQSRDSYFIIVDLMMDGERAGVDLIKLIRRGKLGKRHFLIAMSSSDDPDDINLCYDAGANLYISKYDLVGFGETVAFLVGLLNRVGFATTA